MYAIEVSLRIRIINPIEFPNNFRAPNFNAKFYWLTDYVTTPQKGTSLDTRQRKDIALCMIHQITQIAHLNAKVPFTLKRGPIRRIDFVAFRIACIVVSKLELINECPIST
jgi:hypothetical protein